MKGYRSRTQHGYSPALMLMSASSWDGRSDEEKGWFKEAAKVGAQAMRDKAEADAAQGVAELKAQGMTVVEDVDTAAFQEALEPAYEIYAEQLGKDNVDRIRHYKD